MGAEGTGYRIEIDRKCKELKIPRGNLKYWMDLYFKAYRRERRRVSVNPSKESKISPQEAGVKLFEILTSENTDEGKVADKLMREMFRSPWYPEELEESINGVICFNEFGDIYGDIIREIYLTDRPTTEREICSRYTISHSSYYRRREEALRVFAIVVWGRCIKAIRFEPKRLEYLANYE